MERNKSFAAVQTGKIDKALGTLCWFSISEMDISRDELLIKAKLAGLDERILPPAIRSVDAFRRATSEVAGTTKSPDGTTESLLIREVISDEEKVVRHIILERKDRKNIRLLYQQVGQLEYDRRSEKMFTQVLEEGCKGIVVKAQMLYQKYSKYYTADHLRRTVKNVLTDCQSIALRPYGGVWFSPIQYEQKIEALSSFIKSLPGNNTEIHTMPVVDMDEQRVMLEEKLLQHVQSKVAWLVAEFGGSTEVIEAKKSLKALVGEFSQVLKNNATVSKSTVKNAVEQIQNIRLQVQEYEDLLENNLTEVRSNLEIIRKQVRVMLERVEVAA